MSGEDHLHLALATSAVRTRTLCHRGLTPVNSLNSVYEAARGAVHQHNVPMILRRIPADQTNPDR
jgi:hypothetical protein